MFEVNAYEEFKSLFTNEAKSIWEKESKELRRAAMLLFTIQQEFNRIEHDLQADISRYRIEIENRKDISLCLTPKKEENEHSILLSDESPTINRRRHTNKLLCSPSLLSASKKKNVVSSPLDTKDNQLKKDESYLVCSSEDDEQKPIIKRKNLFKKSSSSINSNLDDVKDLLDNSLMVDQTPNSSITKNVITKNKYKWIDTTKKKKMKQSTIKKMLSGRSKSNFIMPLTKLPKLDNENDMTFCASLENENCLSKLTGSKDLKSLDFHDYDLIPTTNYNLPQHVHKTEAVRKKSERMKLPGWSCEDCEKFYGSLNLSPTKLKQKMDACSKHRNKFAPPPATPEGFWDITMPPTQDAPIL